MIRDLIDLVDAEDTEAAFIFLDQEKAFDRVDHDFLYKTMEAFGIGPTFIRWIKIIYSNASTRVRVNGYLTPKIPLRRGVRQGCPLSPLLYVLVIEILALALRSNPNIVGFTINGEKIVSLHYADDTTITITQNRCFKEVYKELHNYEEASGGKVNYQKTKGLWVGNWKYRLDHPLGIEWTNKNVKNLGVYFGNDKPQVHTFEEIIPNIRRSMNFWKPFQLSKFSKARIIEIFHASRLWYTARFYPIPSKIEKDLQDSFLEYVNFPRTNNTVSKQEMIKLRLDGGLKLIDISAKSKSSKVKWLMEIVENPELNTHKQVITKLIGEQKGGLTGIELFFTRPEYSRRLLSVQSEFYMEAIQAITRLPLHKKIQNLENEKVFYSPLFKDENFKVLPITKTCERLRKFTYGDISAEFVKKHFEAPYNAHVAKIYDKITHTDFRGRSENTMYDRDTQTRLPLTNITQKMVYNELIRLDYKEHHSIAKWEQRFPRETIVWSTVWEALHNPVSHEQTKSIVWEQIHLNDFCTYSYNKWHNSNDACPLCEVLPTSAFHLTLECAVTNNLWAEIEPHLYRLVPRRITEEEKVFGLHGKQPEVILRNWLTFFLRQIISQYESIAYHNKLGRRNEEKIKLAYNEKVKDEVWHKFNILQNLGREPFFRKIFAAKDYLIAWENEGWQILTIFT